jgi:uridine kinase
MQIPVWAGEVWDLISFPTNGNIQVFRPHFKDLKPIICLPMSTNNFHTVLRDVEERGRDIEGCIKQWFNFVKPNFERYVEPQRKVAGQCKSDSLINLHS